MKENVFQMKLLINPKHELTDLTPYHIRQRTDKLRRGIPVPSHGLLIDDLADGEPQGRLQALDSFLVSSKSYISLKHKKINTPHGFHPHFDQPSFLCCDEFKSLGRCR